MKGPAPTAGSNFHPEDSVTTTLNDYQLLAAATSGASEPHAPAARLLEFLGLDAPAADLLARQLAPRDSDSLLGDVQPARLLIAALGLAGEAGEFADEVKKRAGHGHDLDRAKLIKELGDALWYVAECASALGLTLECVAQYNLAKLRERYPQGFSSEASKNRAA